MDPYIVRRIGDVTIERVLPKQQDNAVPGAASTSKEGIPLNQRSGEDIHGDPQAPLMKQGDDGGGDDENDGERPNSVENIGRYDSGSFLKGQVGDIDNSFVSGLTGSSMFCDLNDQSYPGMSMAKDWKIGSSINLDMVKPSSSDLPESLPESDDIQELAPVNITGKNSIKNIDNPLLASKIDTSQYKLGTGISLQMVSNPLTPVKDSSNLSFNNALHNMSSSCDQQQQQQHSQVGFNYNQSSLQHNISGNNLDGSGFTSNLNPEASMIEKPSSFSTVTNLISQMKSSTSSPFADRNISNPSFISGSENDRQNLSINKHLSDNNNANFVQNDFISNNNSQTNDNSIGNFSNNLNSNDSNVNLCHDNSSGNMFRDNHASDYNHGIANLNPPNNNFNSSAPDIYNPNANFGGTSNDKPPMQNYNYNIGNVQQPSFGDNYSLDYKIGGNVTLDAVGQPAMPIMDTNVQKPPCEVPVAPNAMQMNCDNNSGYNNFHNIGSGEMNANNSSASKIQQPMIDMNSSDYKIGSGVSLSPVKSSAKNTNDDLMSRNIRSPASVPSATRPSSVNSLADSEEYKKSVGNEFHLGNGVSLDVVHPKVDNNDFKASSDVSVNEVRPTSETSQDSFNSNINSNNEGLKNEESNPMDNLKALEMLNETDDSNKISIAADKEKKLIKLESMLGEDELDPDEEEEIYGNLEDEEQELEGDINKEIKMEMEDEIVVKEEVKMNEDDLIEDEADDEMGDGEDDDEEGQKCSKRKTPESDDDGSTKGEKKKKKSGNSDDSSSDSDSEKSLMERKTTNLRRNIREVMDESQLDQATLNAQRQEMERLRRVQEQHRIIREVQKQIQMNKQNSKAQTKVISLLQGNTSVLKSNSGQSTSGSQSSKSNTVVVKLSSGSGAPQIVNKKVLEMLKNQKSAATSTNATPKMSTFAKNLLNKPHMMTPSVSIAPVKPKSATCETSTDDLKPTDLMGRKSHSGKQRGKDVVTISSSSSDEDDCILISEPSGGEEEDEEEDPTNSGMHTNDLYNVPDEQGRVFINVGRPDNEPEVFLAPQISRVIKPHQIGGVRFLFDNVVESLERFKTSSGFGCILAHSMGLGKTLQVVSFCDVFLRYTEAKRILCIMPINTLQNWVAEFNMWLPADPSNCPLAAHGEVRPRNFPIFVLNDLQKTVNARAKVIAEWSKQGGVLLIGYELYRQLSLKRPRRTRKSKKKQLNSEDDVVEDHKNKPLLEDMHAALVKPGPDLVICDEGHRIKNSHASISQALKQIRSRRRIVLTGYPLQNNLLEYWCMVDFVRPNYLGTKTEFSNMFERPIQNGQCIDSTPQDIRLMRYRAHVLHSLLEGFVQRRSHSVLTNTLPQKEEYVLLVRMTPFQRQLYDTFMNEVVRTKAVPNPLKAFAVCCKIWNHPDVLYHFLKKRSNSGEAVDLDLDETAPIMPPPGTPIPGCLPGTPGMPGTPTTGAKRGRGRGNAKNASPSQNKRERKKAQSNVQPVNKSPAIAAVIPNTTSNNNNNNNNNSSNNSANGQIQNQDDSAQTQGNNQSSGPDSRQVNNQSNQQFNSNFNQYQQQPSESQQQQQPPNQGTPTPSSYPPVGQNNYNQNYNQPQGEYQNQYQQPYQNQQQSGNFNNSNNYYQNYGGYYPPQNNDPNFNNGNFWNNSYYNNDGQNNFYPGNQFGESEGMQGNNATSGWNQDNFQPDSNNFNPGFNSGNNNNNNNSNMNTNFQNNNQMGSQSNTTEVGMHQKSPNDSLGNQKLDQTSQSSSQVTPLQSPQQTQGMIGSSQNPPSNVMGGMQPPVSGMGSSQSIQNNNMVNNSQNSQNVGGNIPNNSQVNLNNPQNMMGNSQSLHSSQNMIGNNQNQSMTSIPDGGRMSSSVNSQSFISNPGCQNSQQTVSSNMMGNQQNPQNMMGTMPNNPMIGMNAPNTVNISQNMQNNMTNKPQSNQSYMNPGSSNCSGIGTGSQNVMNNMQNSQNMGNPPNLINNGSNQNMMGGEARAPPTMMAGSQVTQNIMGNAQRDMPSNMSGNSHSQNLSNSQPPQNTMGNQNISNVPNVMGNPLNMQNPPNSMSNSQNMPNAQNMMHFGQSSHNMMNNSQLSQNMVGNVQPSQNVMSAMSNTSNLMGQNSDGMIGNSTNIQNSQNLVNNPQSSQNFIGSNDMQMIPGMMSQNLIGNNQMGSGSQNEMSSNSQSLISNSQNLTPDMQNMPSMMNNMSNMMTHNGNLHGVMPNPQTNQNMPGSLQSASNMINNQNVLGNMPNPNSLSAAGTQNQQNVIGSGQNQENISNNQSMPCNNPSQSNFMNSGAHNNQGMMNSQNIMGSVSSIMSSQIDPQAMQIGEGMQSMGGMQHSMIGNQAQNNANQHNVMAPKNTPNNPVQGIMNQQNPPPPPQHGGQNFIGNLSQNQNFIPDHQQNVMGQQMASGNQQSAQMNSTAPSSQNIYHGSQQCLPSSASAPPSVGGAVQSGPQTPLGGPPSSQSVTGNQQNTGQNFMGNNQQSGFHSQHMLDNSQQQSQQNTNYQSGYSMQNVNSGQHEGLLDDLLNNGNNSLMNNSGNQQNPQQTQSNSMNSQQQSSFNPTNPNQSVMQTQQPSQQPMPQQQNYQNNQGNFNNPQYNLGGYQDVTNGGGENANGNYQNTNMAANKLNQQQFNNGNPNNNTNNNNVASGNSYGMYGDNMNNTMNNQSYQDFNRSSGFNDNMQQPQPQKQEFNSYDQQWDVKLSPRSFNKDDGIKKEDCLGNAHDPMKSFKDDTEMKSCGNQTDEKTEIKTETMLKDTTFSFGEMKEISGGCSKGLMKDVATGDKAVGPDSKDEIKELQAPVRSGREDPGIPYDWAERLLKGYSHGDIEASAKMAILFCILEEAMSLGDRILVFSQSLFTLNLIEDFLQRNSLPGRTEKWARNWNYYRLDGSTSALEREKLINEFNSNPNIHLFLVSTRAGSLGINLVGANRVIVFDASWNPCHDTQAVCRVYRYGQKKPCFVYRLVMDNCLEKKIYDRQINKQGMADRVVDECNPDAHLSIKEVTNLCWDSGESEAKVHDMSIIKDKYIDVVMQKVLDKYGNRLSKEPFQHESLLVDRKDKKLSQAEKRLAKRSYELEKQASINSARPVYGYTGTGNQSGLQIRPTFRAIRGDGVNVVNKPMASVRPMQSELSSQLVRDSGRPRSWIPAEVWQKQGMSAQEMTLPLDVVIPTNSPDRSSIVLKAGQKVMVLKSPKGIYMQLENGKIIAIRTAFKVGNKGEKKADKRDFATETKKGVHKVAVQPTRQRIPTNLPMLRNNSNISIIPRNSPGMANRSNNSSTSTTGSSNNQSKPLVRMLGNTGRPWGTPKQPIATTKPYFGETPPVTVTVTKKKVDASTVSTYRSDIRIERDHGPLQDHKDKDMGVDGKDSSMQMMKIEEQKEMHMFNLKSNISMMSDRSERDMPSGMSIDHERNLILNESSSRSKDFMDHHGKGKQMLHHGHHSSLLQHRHQHHLPHDDIHTSDEDEDFDDDEIDELDMHDEVHNVSRSSSTTSSKKLSPGRSMGGNSLVEEGVSCNLGVEEHEQLKPCDNSMAPVSSVHPVRSDDKDKEFTARYPHMSHMPHKSSSSVESPASHPSVSINPLPMLNSSITVSPVSSVSSSATSMSYNAPTMSSASSTPSATLPSLKSSVSINPLANNSTISLNPGTPSVSINPISVNPSPSYHHPVGSSSNRKYTSMEYTADSLAKSSADTPAFPPALSHLKSMTDHSISIFPVESSSKSSTPSSTVTSNSPYNADFNYRQDFQTRHLSGGRTSEYYPNFSQPQIGYPSSGYYPTNSSQRKDVKEPLSSYPMGGTYDSGYGLPPNPFTAAAVGSSYPAARTAFSPGASSTPSASNFPPPPAPNQTPTTQSSPYGSSSGSSEYSRMYSAFHRPEPSSTNPYPPPPSQAPAAPTPHQYNPYNYNPFLMQPHPSYPHVPPSNTQNTSPP